VTGTDEDKGKGKMPKDKVCCRFYLGHAVKSRMTVINRWRAIIKRFRIVNHLFA
jgi:hypothetical protein